MLIDGEFPVAAPPHALMRHLFDARLMASCLPGCESLEALDDERYRAVVAIAMAGVKARFDLLVQITKRDDNNIWATTRGEEGGQASKLQADSQVTLTPSADGTLVAYRSEVSITGRLGRFALGMMKKKAQNLGEEFAVNLRQKLEALEVHAAPVEEAAPMAEDVAASMVAPVATSEPASAPSPSAPATSPAPAITAHAATAPALGVTVAPPAPWWRTLWTWLFGPRAAAPKPGGRG